MEIQRLILRDFRSYHDLDLTFSPKSNLIIGGNGSGKTNLAEAVYYLSLANSWRNGDDRSLIAYGKDCAKAIAVIKEGPISRKIEILISKKGRKILVNDKPIRRLSELSKIVNVILFSPEDVGIFKGPPSDRRAFLNIALSKQSLDYFSLTGKHNRLLSERNAILKNEKPDKTHLEAVTERLIEVMEPIERYRKSYIDGLNKVIEPLQKALYGEGRTLKLVFKPFIKDEGSFKEVAKELYEGSLQSDIYHQVTQIGLQKEDFEMRLDGKDIAKYGSQGENRLASIALKLSPYFMIEEEGKKPVAVLDDIFSELDKEHTQRLSELISSLGQTFVTGTNININGAAYIEVRDNKAIRRK